MPNKIDFNPSENVKYLLYFLATLAICIAVFIMAVFPLGNDKTRINAQMQQANTKLAALQTFAAQNHDYDAFLKIQNAKIADAQKKLPDKIILLELISELQKLSLAYDVQITSIKPNKLDHVKDYYALSVDINMNGDYFHMINFLQQLENNTRFTVLQGAKLGSRNDANPRLNMTVSCVVYSLNGTDLAVGKVNNQKPAVNKTQNKTPAK